MLANAKVRRSLKLWVIERKPQGTPPQQAMLRVASTSYGYRCRDPSVYRVLNEFVKGLKLDATVDACIEAALVSLHADRALAPLTCPKCSTTLLD